MRKWAAGFVVGKLLYRAATGGFGHTVQSLYWYARGKKTWVGIGFGFVAFVIQAGQSSGLCSALSHSHSWVDCDGWLVHVEAASASVSVFLIWLGQIDGALNLIPPSVLVLTTPALAPAPTPQTGDRK